MKRVYETLEIAKDAQNKDCDSVFAVVGRERSGKSNFVLNCLDYLKAELKSIVVDKNKLGVCLESLKEGDTFHFDEAADGLLSKEAQSRWNRDLEKLFMICGAKKLISFIVIPDFFMLSTYFRKNRIVGLFYIYKRGRVMFFDRNRIKRINSYHERYRNPDIAGVRSLYTDTFPIYKGTLFEGYKKLKDEKVKNIMSQFTEKLKEPVKELTLKEKAIEMFRLGYQPKTVAKELKMDYSYANKIKNSLE